MKKYSLAFALIALATVVACVFCACNSNDIPSGNTVKWQDYLNEFAKTVAEDIDNCQSTVGASIVGSMTLNGRVFDVEIYTNVDLHGDSDNIAIRVYDRDNIAFSVLSNDRDTYVEIAQNRYVPTAKLKLQETTLFDWFGILLDAPDVTVAQSIKTAIVELGNVLFMSADANAQRTNYSFGINGDKLGERLSAYIKSLMTFNSEIGNVLLSIFDVKNIDEIFGALTDISGKVNFRIEEDATYIEGEDIVVGNNTANGFSLKLQIEDAYNGKIDALFPQTDAGYKVTKVGSTSIDGSVSLISSLGDKYAVKYDMSMNTNIDLFKWVFNGFDLGKLSDDNFFHFRLSHKCIDGCTEYCRSKIAFASGAVMDIAFSPKHFGTSHIYICLNLKALLSAEYLNRISRYERNVTAASMPEYGMIVIPASNLSENGDFVKMLFKAYAFIVGIDENDSAKMNIEGLRDAFNDMRVANVLIDNILQSDEYDVDTVKVKVDNNVYGQVREYDIYKEVVYLKDYDEPNLKNFASSSLGKDNTAYKWNYESQKTVQEGDAEYTLNNIYDARGENLLHGVSSTGYYVPMSDNENDDLIGSTLKIEYVGYSQEGKTAFCEIVDVEGLDANCFDVQEVILTLKYPNLLDYTFEIGDMTARVVEDLFGGGSELFVQKVKANIKLTREANEKAFEFISADINEKFRLTYNSSLPDMLKAKAIIRYENGLQKEIVTVGQSNSVIISQGLVSKQYSITEVGKATVKFRVAGRNIERYFDVEKPDRVEITTRDGSSTIGSSCSPDAYVTLRAFYGESRVNVKLALKDFYINNVSLDVATLDWEHYTSYRSKYLMFIKSNEYTVQVRKFGTVLGSFTLRISSSASTTPTYQYNVRTEPQNVVLKDSRNQFEGTITNKRHGDREDTTYNLDVKVYEGSASDYGVTYAEADSSIYKVDMTYNGKAVEGSSASITLPSLIVSPISVRFYIAFNKPGVYRINLRLGFSTLYQFYLTVL